MAKYSNQASYKKRYGHLLDARGDNRACAFCGDTRRLCVDHIIPKCVGGPDHIDNLQWLCTVCNSTKGSAGPTRGRQRMFERIVRAREVSCGLLCFPV